MTDKQNLLNGLTIEDIQNLLKMKQEQEEKKKELSIEEQIEKMEEEMKVKKMLLKTKQKENMKNKQKEIYFETLDKPEINFKKNTQLHKLFDKNTKIDYLNGRDICKEKEIFEFLYENSITKFKKDYYVYDEKWKKMNINEIVDICITNFQRIYMSVNLYDIMGMDKMIRNQQYICDLDTKPYKRKFKGFLKDFI